MGLHAFDWLIVIVYLVFSLGIGLYFSKRARKSLSSYFVSGRNLPWWILGTSMVATTFAADTPLAITGIVAKDGISGNWLWWNMAASHAMAAFFFSKLWRRAEIITDLELIEIRYSGKSASFLRGFRALWEGIFLNAIIMGWVILAMTKIIDVLFDLSSWNTFNIFNISIDPKWQAIILCLIIAFIYCVLSGFWGVVITDFVQFIFAMFGSILLAIIVVYKSGGMDNIVSNLYKNNANAEDLLSFFPSINSAQMPFVTFIAFIAVNWWATKIVDGGGYIAQRMFSAKNERHSYIGTLWFTVAHYALRPWPWIIVALASMVIYPNLTDPELGYPKMVVDYLPVGLKGVMIAAFLAAFMSTIDTHLNWGASLLINDFYKCYINKDKSDKHYITASKWSVAILMIAGALAAYTLSSVSGAWKLLFAMTAGIGGVYIARWLWWRVNAMSEITAWLSSAAAYLILTKVFGIETYGWILIGCALISTILWITVTLITPPVEEKKLIDFYKKVRPGSPFWKPISNKISDLQVVKTGWSDLTLWLSGVIFIYSSLFFIGKLIFGLYIQSAILFIIAFAAGIHIAKTLKE